MTDDDSAERTQEIGRMASGERLDYRTVMQERFPAGPEQPDSGSVADYRAQIHAQLERSGDSRASDAIAHVYAFTVGMVSAIASQSAVKVYGEHECLERISNLCAAAIATTADL